MKFSTLTDILLKANMITDVTIPEDCEVEDLNLMDQDYREFGDHVVYFIRSEEIGAGTALPQCLLYQNLFPEYRAAGLRNLRQNPGKALLGRGLSVCKAATEYRAGGTGGICEFGI